MRGRWTAGDGRNGGLVAGGLAEELRVGYSALIQPKVVGNARVYVVVCRSRPQHGPRARAPERKKKREESGMIKGFPTLSVEGPKQPTRAERDT